MKLLKRVFWALDEHLGGAVRPTEARLRAVRHPVPFGVAATVYSGGISALTLGRLDWPIALSGCGFGVLFGLLVVVERKRTEHRGFSPERAGSGPGREG